MRRGEPWGAALMARTGLGHAYEVTLGPAALRVVLGMDESRRKNLADALRTELLNGPNASKEVQYNVELRVCRAGEAGIYTATPLSFDGYVAVHRPLAKDELKALRQEQGRSAASKGFHVFDLLAATSAFSRFVPLPR